MAYKCASNLAPEYLCAKLKNDLLYIIAQPVIMRSSKSHYSGQPLANVPSPTEQYPCGTR